MHDSSRPVPFRLVTGGTRAADIAVLRALLAERLALRGLAGPAGGPYPSAPASPQPPARPFSLPSAASHPPAAPGAKDPGTTSSPYPSAATAAPGAEYLDQVSTGLGEPPVLVPVGPREDHEVASADMRRRLRRLPEGTDLVLRTSGSSTGTGRLVAVSLGSLVASAWATHARLGGPGRWVLALPAHHVAGLQVLLRSVVAGREPVVVDASAGFSVPALAGGLRRALEGDGRGSGHGGGPASEAAGAAASGAASTPVYVSLVPTQLVRVLQDEEATRALARVRAVLLGGAAASPGLLARARAVGVPVVTTYGASETGGGCVYDGLPLGGVEVALDAEGRILLSGPVLASGYVGDGAHDLPCTSAVRQHHASRQARPWRDRSLRQEGTATPASSPPSAAGEDLRQDADPLLWRPGARLPVPVRPGFHCWPAADGTGHVRVLATSDRGGLEGGRLEVLGRMDGFVNTGGVKVDPREVEDVLTGMDGVAEACVVGVPDGEWGTAVVAAVVARPGAVVDGAGLCRAARAVLDGVRAPKRVEVIEALPLRGPGKVDRLALRELLSASRGGG